MLLQALIAGNPKLQPYLNVMNKMSYYTTDAIIWAGNVRQSPQSPLQPGMGPLA